MNWDEFFMSMAYLIAMKSKDTSSKLGCVIVGPDHEVRSIGYNGIPRGCVDKGRNKRPLKYFYQEHAERNAIFNAARMGLSVKSCTLYVTGMPCADCARAIIQSGVNRVVISGLWDWSTSRSKKKWVESTEHSKKMLNEAGVSVEAYRGPLVSKIYGWKSGKVLELKATKNGNY